MKRTHRIKCNEKGNKHADQINLMDYLTQTCNRHMVKIKLNKLDDIIAFALNSVREGIEQEKEILKELQYCTENISKKEIRGSNR